MKKVNLVLVTLIILLITNCSKKVNTINVQPLKTTIKGELGDYISIVNDEYTITKIKDDLSANWEISFKLKTLKSGDFNTDSSDIDFRLQLVDEKGKPITGLGNFRMSTGLWGTASELKKLRVFINGKENEEDWFTLPMQVKNKDFENKLPKNATHFIIRTIVKGKAISKNQNEVKIEDNQDNDILKTIYTGKAENDDIMLKFNKITKDSLFGEHTLQSTANGNIRIKLLKGVFTKDQNNTINATLTEYKLNNFEKPKYKTNGVLKFNLSDKKIKGIIDFATKNINFNLTPITVSNEEFESRDFGNIYNDESTTSNTKPTNEGSNIDIEKMLNEYDEYVKSYVKLLISASKGDTNSIAKSIEVMNKATLFYEKLQHIDESKFTLKHANRMNTINSKMLEAAMIIQNN